VSDGPRTTTTLVPAGPLLEVSDLALAFGGVRAVDGLSLTIRAGQVTGLIGPNGAGKSTALGIIAGASRPDRGSVRFRGDDVTGSSPRRMALRGVARTFQTSSEFPRLTVLENLLVSPQRQRGEQLLGCFLGKWYWRRQEAELVEKAWTTLAQFEMKEKAHEYAGSLSGGQKRLLEIMRGLMADPVLLLLDEPMAGVNPSLALRVEQHLIELRDGGLTMLLVEHELGVVERVCDHIVVMAQGRVLESGTMDSLRASTQVVRAYLGN
jgi:ABC-type branched-subunit amino acid transport system ATPase component